MQHVTHHRLVFSFDKIPDSIPSLLSARQTNKRCRMHHGMRERERERERGGETERRREKQRQKCLGKRENCQRNFSETGNYVPIMVIRELCCPRSIPPPLSFGVLSDSYAVYLFSLPPSPSCSASIYLPPLSVYLYHYLSLSLEHVRLCHWLPRADVSVLSARRKIMSVAAWCVLLMTCEWLLGLIYNLEIFLCKCLFTCDA